MRQTIKMGRDKDKDTGRDNDEDTGCDEDEDTGRDEGGGAGRDSRNTVAGFPQLLCLRLVSVQIVIVIAVSNTQAELS